MEHIAGGHLGGLLMSVVRVLGGSVGGTTSVYSLDPNRGICNVSSILPRSRDVHVGDRPARLSMLAFNVNQPS